MKKFTFTERQEKLIRYSVQKKFEELAEKHEWLSQVESYSDESEIRRLYRKGILDEFKDILQILSGKEKR